MSTNLPIASDTTARLREAFLAASFTVDGLLELLGAPAYAALARSETIPALRATRGDSALATLVRLFLLQGGVDRDRAAAVLPLREALDDGWLSVVHSSPGDEVRATVDVRPYGGPQGEDWWIVSDPGCAVGGASGIRGPEKDRENVVLGVGGASTTLAGLVVREPVDRALDLGTGSGILALHLGRHATEVTATDLNPRALRFAELTLALSDAPEAELREGSLFEPVDNEEPYDLIVSNPPFVISPGRLSGEDRALTYRDGGLSGDALCRTLVQNSAARLAPGGYCQLLANWQHISGEDWRDRVRGWVPRGCDAWIVQREIQDVNQYTELWLRDAGAHLLGSEEYARRYDAWLTEFERSGTEAVGFGWISLRRTDSEQPSLTLEEWTHPVEQPLGETVREHFARQDFLRRHDDAALLDTRFVLAEGVVQEQVGPPGAEDPEHVVLRQSRGMMRATKVDTVGAGFAGVCDGTLSAGRILDAIAQLVGEDAVALRDRTPDAIRLLVEQGFLLPSAEG
ncbi:class I SAM-dependent methyltransferase [Streptomyces sp. P38-E01]|uniref:Class I SAM-dependent methyltransferase n=1 Tax=Streptomyces tardus TaxID=2780544 RepID=A0A949JE03_9ACTN|nr:class I SAM-dependent methyltransferase [Streptomyces tardus]MBU7597253.1 class I SAM-dependent methyltransferase [Streptomyces tardus]